MKTICAIQPYVFPYLPYFQLAQAVDEFWVLDDVQFIRRGWMNRNAILVAGARHRFTLPVKNGARADLVAEKALAADFAHALDKLRSTVRTAYARAPHADVVLALLEELAKARHTRFLDLALDSLRLVFARLNLAAPLRLSSELALAESLRGEDRIIEICRLAGAQRYVNPIGGVALYNDDRFRSAGLDLRFLLASLQPYPQGGTAVFEPGLSILDFLAWVSPKDYEGQLRSCALVTGPEARG